MSKESIQEDQYHFPYHHLSHEKNGSIYIFRHLFWGLEHLTYIQFVIQQIVTISPKNMLDIGCGEGRVIQEIEKISPSITCHGADISERAIGFARAFTNKSTFAVHDITQNPTETKYDLIVSCEVIEHIPPALVQTYVDNIWKSLAPGGKLIITTPTTNIPVNAKHYQHFTSEIFDSLLDGKFNNVTYNYLNKASFLTYILDRILANRLFISNSQLVNRAVLSFYKKHLLHAAKNTGSRIVVTATKAS